MYNIINEEFVRTRVKDLLMELEGSTGYYLNWMFYKEIVSYITYHFNVDNINDIEIILRDTKLKYSNVNKRLTLTVIFKDGSLIRHKFEFIG